MLYAKKDKTRIKQYLSNISYKYTYVYIQGSRTIPKPFFMDKKLILFEVSFAWSIITMFESCKKISSFKYKEMLWEFFVFFKHKISRKENQISRRNPAYIYKCLYEKRKTRWRPLFARACLYRFALRHNRLSLYTLYTFP